MAVTALGRDVQRLTAWASTTVSGDRDDLKPGVGDRSWSQVSVSARECLGVARCPFGSECFSERARGAAGLADVVVTNHALLAIDAVAESAVLPEHRLLVVDEAHELADRVTSVAAAELTSATLGMAARRITRLVDPKVTQRLQAASATFSSAIHDARPGRIDCLDDEMATYLSALRDAASAARSAIDTGSDTTTASVRAEAGAVLTEISDTASRILASFAPAIPDRSDVVWLEHEDNHESARAVLRVAPLSVAELLATQVFARATTVLTSATLTIGGSFDAMATAWGLTADTPWRGLDVGSPFQHAKSGILYVAAHLPPPGRDGSGSAEQLTEIAELITAAGGRTLGLFSSMRAARAATEAMRERLSTPVLCQGDDSTSTLVEKFTADAATSLFGTLSLWQGVDVPGPSLSLVLIDRIPFPRPDDPLLSARQRAVAARGGNGFMTVAASHAALLLAQDPAGCYGASPIGAWLRCSIHGWLPPAMANSCEPRCRPFGRPPTPRKCARPCGALREQTQKPTKSARFRSFCVFSAGQARVTRPSSLLAASIGWRGSTRTVYPTGPASGSGVVVEKIS